MQNYVSKLCDLLVLVIHQYVLIQLEHHQDLNRLLDLNETDLPSITRGQLISLKSALKASALKQLTDYLNYICKI
jgi:hypothetical protein